MFTCLRAAVHASDARQMVVRHGELGGAICVFGTCAARSRAPRSRQRDYGMLTTRSITPSHRDPSSGTGRFMACRPVGMCPPERKDRGWWAGTGARRTRVSEMRTSAVGGAGRLLHGRERARAASSSTGKRRMGERIVRGSG